MTKNMAKVLAVASVLLCMSAGAMASELVGAGEYTGSRSTSVSNIVASDGWEQSEGGFMLSWEITAPGQNQDGLWHYQYTLSNADGSVPAAPSLSHWILEVSPGVTSTNWGQYIPSVTAGTVLAVDDFTSSSNGNSNPYLPGTLHGIKFDGGNDTFAFTSSQAPVWGDFYAKDGKHEDGSGTKEFATAWNTGIGGDPTASQISFTSWIPTPDNVIVPEPGLCALAATALLAGAFARRRVRKTGLQDAAA